ncbi:hypothetical protein TNCV_655041 [Trichonephila clavipes]|nr:hypothetical protein TNCV_655041 [Trichonephila clavipes]
MVRHWCSEFSEGRQNVLGEERSTRSSLKNDDFVKLLWQRVMESRRFTIMALNSHLTQISRSFLHEIVTKNLQLKKIVCQVVAEKPDTRTQNSTLRSITDFSANVLR